MAGRGIRLSVLQMVSPMLTSASPVTAQMSPAITSSTGTRVKLEKTKTSAILPVFDFSSPADGCDHFKIVENEPNIALQLSMIVVAMDLLSTAIK